MRHNYTQNRRYQIKPQQQVEIPELIVWPSEETLKYAVLRYRCGADFVDYKKIPCEVDGAPKNEGQSDPSHPFLEKYSNWLSELAGLKKKGTREKEEQWHAKPSDALVNGDCVPTHYFKPVHLLGG